MTTRRQFLYTAGAGVMTPFLAGLVRPWSVVASAAEASSVFGLSVASGDPSPTGVVLWTRVNPEAYVADRPLRFEVARDAGFRQVALAGEIAAEDFGPDHDHTVHLDLDGWLQPNHVYYYRFVYGDVASRTGRCRTLPLPAAPARSLRLGVVTCQDYTNGYYGAFAHLAQDDVDFVLHLGDLIYETSGDPRFQSLPYPDRAFMLPSGAPAATGLDDYRFLYRLYRSDPLFQMTLERHTLICLWDDHETANDAYWDYDRDTLGAPDHPLVVNSPDGGDPAQLRQLKRESQQAWAEYVPARVLLNPAATHPHDYLQIYRRFRYGTLVDLFATDERTYRSPHPCGETERDRYATTGCDERTSPTGTLLGTTQRDWFVAGVIGSDALWKAWANEVCLAELKLGRGDGTKLFFTLDSWDGYEAERRQILGDFVRAGVRNLVALTGDLHSYLAAYLKVDYRLRSNRPGPNVAGVEFMTPAVTSSTLLQVLLLLLSPDERADLLAADNEQAGRFLLEGLAQRANPHIHFFDSQEWGYSIVEFTRTACTYTAYSVDTSVNSPAAARRLIRQIQVPVNQTVFRDIV